MITMEIALSGSKLEGAKEQFEHSFGRPPTNDDTQTINLIMQTMKKAFSIWEEIDKDGVFTKEQILLSMLQYDHQLSAEWTKRAKKIMDTRETLISPLLNSHHLLHQIRQEQNKLTEGLISGVAWQGSFAIKDFAWIISDEKIKNEDEFVQKQGLFIETLQHERVHTLKSDEVKFFKYDIPFATAIGILTAQYSLSRFGYNYQRWDSFAKKVYQTYYGNEYISEIELHDLIISKIDTYEHLGEVEKSYYDGLVIAFACFNFFFSLNYKFPLVSSFVLLENLAKTEDWKTSLDIAINYSTNIELITKLHNEQDGINKLKFNSSTVTDLKNSGVSMYKNAFGDTDVITLAVINNLDRLVTFEGNALQNNELRIPRYQWRKKPLQ